MEASNLRAELDHLLERFRGDTSIDIESHPDLVQELRLALEEEFIMLISQYSKEVLQKAVLMTFDDSKRLPIHLACDKNAPLSVLKILLEADVDKVSIRMPDKWGDLPLHTACSRHQTGVVKLLVDSDVSRETLHTKADNGSLPLHTAVRYGAPTSVVQLLLDDNESTLMEQGFYGQLPLHVACRNGAAPDVVQLLLNHDEAKRSVLQEDNVGGLPVHLALLHTTEKQLEVVEILLKGMLCHRMERKGLDLWKAHMKSILKSMKTHERDFSTRDKLDIISEVIQDFMHRVFELELAVWRASCLKFDTKFSTMQDVLDYESALAYTADPETNFDAHAYKVDRRIKSGADIIVRDVFPFLENEPVEEVVKRFKDYQ